MILRKLLLLTYIMCIVSCNNKISNTCCKTKSNIELCADKVAHKYLGFKPSSKNYIRIIEEENDAYTFIYKPADINTKKRFKDCRFKISKQNCTVTDVLVTK